MKISGEATMRAPIERVWEALHDPALLARTIPGCERLQATVTGAYLITVTAAVASTKGTYSGTAQVHDSTPPSSFAVSASAAGAPGTVDSDVQVRLSEVDGSTRLRYDADATAGGRIGGLGQRLLTSVAQRTADEFLAAVNDVLTGEQAAVNRTDTPPSTSCATPAAVSRAPGRTTRGRGAGGRATRRSVPLGVLVAAAAGFAAGAVWGRRRC